MTLSVKIIGTLLLTVVGLSSLFIWTFSRSEGQAMHQLLARQGQALARTVASFSIEPLLVEDYPLLESALQTIGAGTPDLLAIEVVHDGKRVAGLRPEMSGVDGERFVSPIRLRTLVGDQPDIVLGEVRLVLSRQNNQLLVAERLADTRLQIGVAFMILFGVLWLILRWLVLRRIEGLTRLAEEISSTHGRSRPEIGEALTAAPEPGFQDEIGRLTASLEQMRRTIDEKQQLLRRHAESLEQGIAARTQELLVAKERAESSDRAKTSFLTNMSHEIRTPLSGILGFTQLLAATGLGPKQADYLRTIDQSAKNLRVIIDDILDHSKIETGRLGLAPRAMDLPGLMGATVALLMPQAYAKGLELVQGLAAELPAAIVADPVRLRQILTNLLDNGIKFTAAGTLSLWAEPVTREGQAHIRFEVSDTGIGIAPGDIPRLFTAFSQVDSSLTRRYSGTGLGLAISKQLVERMGGVIGVESESTRGSRFWFVIPLVPAGLPAAAPAVASPVRTLVYDPSALARRALDHGLRRLGLGVRVLDDPGCLAEVLRDPLAERPELLVWGLAPGDPIDGLPPELSALAVEPGLKVLVLANSLHRPAGLAIGQVLPKALDLASLGTAVRRLLAGAEAAGATVPTPAGSPEALGQDLRVLVVDDNALNLDLEAELLRARGVQVLAAASGPEALSLFQRQPLDLVLMDIQMPGMSGLETAQRMRELEQDRDMRTPIVAVTAHAFPDEREQYRRAGLDDCLTKPLDSDALWALVLRWTGRMRAPETLGLPAPAPTPAPPEAPIHDREAALKVTGGNAKLADDLWRRYLGLLPGYQERLRGAWQGGDWAALRAEAHSLAGAAAYGGAPAIKAVATALDRALIRGDLDQVDAQVQAVADAIDRAIAWSGAGEATTP